MAALKFKFEEIATFKTPVDIVTPDGERQAFTGVFAYIDDKAADELAKLPVTDGLRQVWKGWEDIVGPDDKPLPFSEAQLELFLGHGYINNATLVAFFRGRQGLRAKN